MSSDALYWGCIDETIKLYAQQRGQVFMYSFEHKGENSMVNLLVNNRPTLFDTGVCHGDELFYLFNLRINGMRNPSFDDEKVGDRILTLWTDFGKYGYAPRVDNYEFPRWEPFDTNRMIYLKIGRDLTIGRHYRQREAHFWNQHLRNISGLGPFFQAQTQYRPMYKTLAWAMVAVSVSLLILIVVLLSILYYQRRRQRFSAGHVSRGSSHLSGGSTLY